MQYDLSPFTQSLLLAEVLAVKKSSNCSRSNNNNKTKQSADRLFIRCCSQQKWLWYLSKKWLLEMFSAMSSLAAIFEYEIKEKCSQRKIPTCCLWGIILLCWYMFVIMYVGQMVSHFQNTIFNQQSHACGFADCFLIYKMSPLKCGQSEQKNHKETNHCSPSAELWFSGYCVFSLLCCNTVEITRQTKSTIYTAVSETGRHLGKQYPAGVKLIDRLIKTPSQIQIGCMFNLFFPQTPRLESGPLSLVLWGLLFFGWAGAVWSVYR